MRRKTVERWLVVNHKGDTKVLRTQQPTRHGEAIYRLVIDLARSR